MRAALLITVLALATILPLLAVTAALDRARAETQAAKTELLLARRAPVPAPAAQRFLNRCFPDVAERVIVEPIRGQAVCKILTRRILPNEQSCGIPRGELKCYRRSIGRWTEFRDAREKEKL